MISTQNNLSVSPPDSALMYVIAFPVRTPPFRAIHIDTAEHALRTSPGGIGARKHAPNYAPAPVPAPKGISQNLWLFPDIDPETGRKEEYITEAGTMDLYCTMNIFYAVKTRDGQREILTAPVGSTILEGLMRLCVVELARERLVPEGWLVSERKITMRELMDMADEGRILEVFGTSTAAVVVPIRSVGYNGRSIPCGLEDDQVSGPIARQMKDWIENIQYGEVEHPWR